MSEQKDNQVLEEYLKGNSLISRHYREEARLEPSPQIDASIMSAAKKAMENKKAGTGSFTSRWYIPLSLAAVVVISFSVVFKIYDQDEQQIFSKHIETESEKPATMMDDKMEHAAGEPAAIMQDKIISKEKIEMKNEADRSSSSSFRKDAVPAASALSKEVGPHVTPATGNVQIPAEKQMMESSDSTFATDSPVATDALVPEQWFEIINQLWFENNEKGAYTGLKNFLEAYPDYPVDELKNQLPEGMDFSQITR